ncbi:GNAT family N-acetyltransferase [uncultured Jannaschia sp.]|uniref:GNAT family N-acetyltransferase n=1 Tax=uncultured Jannaschia sp. TaxID=293347 RepID=UPI00261CF5C6|nr:GNAT family N-acetyltransferase [uncultured Jannaschia sp.]
MLEPGLHSIGPGHIAAVVTHLEMRAPPPSLDAAMPAGMTLRRVAAPDPDWYRDLFLRVGGLNWMWFSRLRLSRTELSAILADADVEVFALEIDGRAEGLLELDFRDEQSCELAFLGLAPAAQSKGAGRALIEAGIARAFARPIARLHIHTCTFDSPVALPFYIRSGFVPVRREVEVVEDPRLDGTIPMDAAPQIPRIR